MVYANDAPFPVKLDGRECKLNAESNLHLGSGLKCDLETGMATARIVLLSALKLGTSLVTGSRLHLPISSRHA
jgi:hypothetical protein